MTAEVLAKAILVAGALLLVLGPGLQARLEMREYHDLLEALKGERDLPEVAREYLGLLAIGPSSALHSPLAAVRFFLSTLTSGWYPQFRTVRAAFRESGAAADERVVEIRTHLTRARNWAIVVAGSVLIFSGTSIELARAIADAQGA